ncbi:MAG TPA: amidohydrolase family protein, partial [Gemmataceae bacterium]|nr:amidohydrolase family protein [Gemmataceae bacterium]
MPISRDHSKNLSLAARWVFPVEGPPLERGIVVIAGDRIVAVEPRGTRTTDLDLGNVAILPGFVNAHTHLDLSGARGKCPPTPKFADWLHAVIHYRRSQTAGQVEADIRAGLAMSLSSGTTLLGDISARGTSWQALIAAPMWSVVFYELVGLPAAKADEAFEGATVWL